MPILVSKPASPTDTTDAPSPVRFSSPAQLVFTPPLPATLNPPTTSGTISIEDACVRFTSSDREWSVDYPSIMIYAISRAPPCIYCQLDEMLVESELPGGESAEQEQDEDTPAFEMRIVPEDSEKLDSLFEALAQCAAKHPDKNAMEEDDGDDGWMMTADDFDGAEFEGARQAALDHLDSVFVGGVRKETEDRFEDADETDAKRRVTEAEEEAQR
ncbi:hypothetical protein HDU98_000758 [Podochytrium sp. JEL0797]|nr:hypothetical protein HDU98_000758 [Podochytrium sp. JEL0797]